MRRSPIPFFFFLLSLAFATSTSFAQQPSNDAARLPSPANSATVLNLLVQAHDLNELVPLQRRLQLLEHEAEKAAEVRPALGAQWAEELIAASAQVSPNQGTFPRDRGIAILARTDPDRALALLHVTSAKTASDKLGMARNDAAARIFNQIVAIRGEAALPMLEQEAVREGVNGPFPYAAIGAAARGVSYKLRGDREHALAVEQSVFDWAFTRYESQPATYPDDIEFGNMLESLAGGLPASTIRPALEALVRNALTADPAKYPMRGEVVTTDAQIARVDDPADTLILWHGALINRVDPDLAAQLKSTRPELRVALDYAQDGRQRSGSFGEGFSRPINPSAELHSDAMRLASVQPEAAIERAQKLPDPSERASTLLAVANSIAGNDPERAAFIIGQVEASNAAAGDSLRLSLITAKANVAASTDNMQQLEELLREGFEVATQAAGEHQAQSGVSLRQLASLVQLGAQNDRDNTVAFVQSLPPSEDKIRLLLSVVDALRLHSRLPFGSHVRSVNDGHAQARSQ